MQKPRAQIINFENNRNINKSIDFVSLLIHYFAICICSTLWYVIVHVVCDSARSKSGRGGGRVGRLHMCHPPYHHPLIFKAKLKIFCHLTLLKIRFKITVTPSPPPPPSKNEQGQNYGASRNFNGLQTLWVDF